MSTLTQKLKEHAKNYILVSETLDLIAQSSKSALNEVKEYLLISKIDEHTPIFYKDKDFRFINALDDNKNGVFNSTHKALTKPLVGNEYFSIKSLNEFTPLDEYDIFAHKRGYYYVAQHSVGRFKTGAYVIGLDDDHANWLLSTGAIEKLSIQEVEDRQSAQVKEQKKQIEALEQQLAALTAENDRLNEQLSKQVDTPANDSILQTILDDSHEYHAPDLKHAIQLWHDLYIDGLIGTDSHSNKADRWISSNTSYGNNAEDSSVKRLRQVSTPLKDFGGQRKR